jgi:hypothetical protein
LRPISSPQSEPIQKPKLATMKLVRAAAVVTLS